MCMGSEHHSKISKEVHTYEAYLDYTGKMLFGVSCDNVSSIVKNSLGPTYFVKLVFNNSHTGHIAAKRSADQFFWRSA